MAIVDLSITLFKFSTCARDCVRCRTSFQLCELFECSICEKNIISVFGETEVMDNGLQSNVEDENEKKLVSSSHVSKHRFSPLYRQVSYLMSLLNIAENYDKIFIEISFFFFSLSLPAAFPSYTRASAQFSSQRQLAWCSDIPQYYYQKFNAMEVNFKSIQRQRLGSVFLKFLSPKKVCKIYSISCLFVCDFFIASIATLPMAFGCLLGGYLMDRFGRKTAHLILNVPFVMGWCVISMSDSMIWLLFGRLLTGFCVGVLSPLGPTYLGEITDKKYRGFFLAAIPCAVAFGIFFTHLFALFVTWKINAIICGVLPFISYLLITFIPESPTFLLKSNRIEAAFSAHKWFRGQDEEVIQEFKDMVDAQHINKSDDTENCEPSEQKNRLKHLCESITCTAFYTPLIILTIYFATLQFSGTNAVIFYTVSILKESLGSDIDEYIATLVIDAVRLIASIVACIAVKNIRRRSLTVFSGITTSICLFGLSAYLYFAVKNIRLSQITCIPLILFIVYIFVLSIGLSPLPWCLTGELFPLRFRAICSAFVTFFNFLFFFVVVKTSPLLFETYGGNTVFFGYGCLALLGTIFLTAYLPETKNKSLKEIEDSYTANKKTRKLFCRNKVRP